MTYSWYIWKRRVEDVFIFPFIVIGRAVAVLNPLKKEYQAFFFFPFYHTGGAEKVHALITQATGNKDCIIYFTRKSVDDNFYKDFVQSGCDIRDISKYTDNKFLYFINLIFRGIITGYINSQKTRPIVFNGQCNFGYKISPWVKKEVAQLELIHSFNTFSSIRLPFLPFYKQTVMISKVRISDHLEQYKKLHVPTSYNEKIIHIVNGIPVPETISLKQYEGRLKVLYVGRGTEEKRVHLVAEMASIAAAKNLEVDFIFMGDVKEAIPQKHLSYCKLLGHQTDPSAIAQIYQEAHVIIITSYTEGFPLAIEEGMTRECAVIATPVGDIPVHVKHGENGFLFSRSTDEKLIVQEGIEFISLLHNDRVLLKEIGERNRHYALEHFSLENFTQQYRKLFIEQQPGITF